MRAMRLTDSWDFDVFLVDRITDGAALVHVFKLLVRKRNLVVRVALMWCSCCCDASASPHPSCVAILVPAGAACRSS